MKILINMILVYAIILFSGCAMGVKLSPAEKEKLDPALQQLILDDSTPEKNYSVTLTKDGQKLYGVIISCVNPDDLEKAGIVPNTISGEIVTARITVAEMRKAVQIETVKSIKNSSKSFPN